MIPSRGNLVMGAVIVAIGNCRRQYIPMNGVRNKWRA